MECGRSMIYFSTYENGIKTKRAGYAGIFTRGNVCDVQIYYRENGMAAEEKVPELHPVYVFRDGCVTEGTALFFAEGMAVDNFRTSRRDFMQSGRNLEELEVIYIDGVRAGICGGRMDGQDLTEEVAYTLTDWVEAELEATEKGEKGTREEPAFLGANTEDTGDVFAEQSLHQAPAPERWPLPQCLERFPELKLPFDGIRRRCCRMTLEDLGHLPEEWAGLADNHFLLHGYYEYHHLLFARLACRYGERYAVGVPGEFCYRNQYMAENFGFFDFAPLEPGKRRGGSFGYWYFYLEKK